MVFRIVIVRHGIVNDHAVACKFDCHVVGAIHGQWVQRSIHYRLKLCTVAGSRPEIPLRAFRRCRRSTPSPLHDRGWRKWPWEESTDSVKTLAQSCQRQSTFPVLRAAVHATLKEEIGFVGSHTRAAAIAAGVCKKLSVLDQIRKLLPKLNPEERATLAGESIWLID